MKCIDCNACKKGYFKSATAAYVCTGVKEPFVIDDVNSECTEYKTVSVTPQAQDHKPGFFVADDAIKYRETLRGGYWNKTIIPKEIFIEAYNKWIKNEEMSRNGFCGEDDADCWCD